MPKLAQNVSKVLICFSALGSLIGCSGAPVQKGSDPKLLLERACAPGSSVQVSRGSVFIRAQSKDAKGQFAAEVKASAPSTLWLEAVNPLGGTEAVITVEGSQYKISLPSQKDREDKGTGSWSGIPLQWATRLFLGGVPCPAPGARERALMKVAGEDELSVETTALPGHDPEKFVYRFRRFQGNPWPEALHWERKGQFPTSVDFKFDDPEEKTLSPRKWEAKSAQGEVKVRWRERNTSGD